jgi:hypothetical protein
MKVIGFYWKSDDSSEYFVMGDAKSIYEIFLKTNISQRWSCFRFVNAADDSVVTIQELKDMKDAR